MSHPYHHHHGPPPLSSDSSNNSSNSNSNSNSNSTNTNTSTSANNNNTSANNRTQQHNSGLVHPRASAPAYHIDLDSLVSPQLGGPAPQGGGYQPPSSVYYASQTGRHDELQHAGVHPTHLFPPNSDSDAVHEQQQREHERQNQDQRQPMSLVNPSRAQPFSDPTAMHLPLSYTQQQQLAIGSPYDTPSGMMPLNSGSSASAAAAQMTDYFQPINASSPPPSSTIPVSQPFLSPWQGQGPATSHGAHAAPSSLPQQMDAGSSASASKHGPAHGAKTNRQQFTACGACRHRRVKCDLKDRQEAAERAAADGEDGAGGVGVGPQRSRRKKVSCTNCQERGTNCIDEYAPLKAAKQLRRGKRISEIEMLYGKSAAVVAAATTFKVAESPSPKGKERALTIPDLTKEFFDSPFFRRFQVQRPVLDPGEFVGRYCSRQVPTAAAMGTEGAILVHVLYAWAVSYGVDETGRLDVPEGGGGPLGPVDLLRAGEGETAREAYRQARKEKMRAVLEVVLKEIDVCGVMRKPTWDGVRALLLVLPLTEGVSTQVERLAMYEAAVSQVYTLCSFLATGYDGAPSAAAAINGGSDDTNETSLLPVRVRIYWYAFVHEGITSGLKGGRLHLDEEDFETMQESINSRALVLNANPLRAASKLATAPINLALACRLVNKALTGPRAKRRRSVDTARIHEAWEALERCWEEFDSLNYDSPGSHANAFRTSDEIVRQVPFADGWKIFLFEGQNIIRTNLEGRLKSAIEAQASAFISQPNSSSTTTHGEVTADEILGLQHLLDIAQSKCEVKTRQIVEMVKRHVGTRFFEWDASLVRDGTYYAAMLLARIGGSDEDVSVCVHALNELRWAHAKAWERSADLRREWAAARIGAPVLRGWDPSLVTPSAVAAPSHSKQSSDAPTEVDTPYTSPDLVSPTFDMAVPMPPSRPLVHPGAQASGFQPSLSSAAAAEAHSFYPGFAQASQHLHDGSQPHAPAPLHIPNHHSNHPHSHHHHHGQNFDHPAEQRYEQTYERNNNPDLDMNLGSSQGQGHGHNNLGLDVMELEQKPWIPSLHGPGQAMAQGGGGYLCMDVHGFQHQQPPPLGHVHGSQQHLQQQHQQQQQQHPHSHQQLHQQQQQAHSQMTATRGQYVIQQDGSQVFVTFN